VRLWRKPYETEPEHQRKGRYAEMNAIVVTALKRPYTFVVLAILILLFGTMSVFKTPTDIFPPIKIPVVASVWSYNGLMPSDMSGRVVYYYERALTTTVGNIEHIESQSLYGSGIVKIFFQPGTDVAAAQAQVTATSQTVIKQLPAGITPRISLCSTRRPSRCSTCRSPRTI
jgi:multidrug efflux pump subunit AcrB